MFLNYSSKVPVTFHNSDYCLPAVSSGFSSFLLLLETCLGLLETPRNMSVGGLAMLNYPLYPWITTESITA